MKKQPEQWKLPSERETFPGGHLALVKSVVGAHPDEGSMLMQASDAEEAEGLEQSTELLMQLMSLFQKKHGRLPTEEEVRQWGDVFRTTVSSRALLFRRKCLQSRFKKVNSSSNPPTYPAMLLI